MKKYRFGKLLLIVIVVVMIFSIASVALAVDYPYYRTYSISNLAPYGGVLWSTRYITHSAGDEQGFITQNSCTSGTHMTCRIYYGSSKTMNYLNVYPNTNMNDDYFYDAYDHWKWNGKMKFSNDATTSFASSGLWGSRCY